MSNDIKWLLSISIMSGIIGWVTYGFLTEEILIWALPIYCFCALLVTVNGDNILEASIILLITGILAFLLHPLISERYGLVGIVPSVYITLFLTKIFYSLAKMGALGNEKFT